MILVQSEELVGKYAVHDYVKNDRRDPVYKNKIVPVFLNPQEDYVIRRMKATQIQNQMIKDQYEEFFTQIPVTYPKGYETDHTDYGGAIVPKNNMPKSWTDYDIYTSRASHVEITSVALGYAPDKETFDMIPLFDLKYLG